MMKSNFTSFFFMIVFLASILTESFAQTNWTKYLGNPVLTKGPVGAWDEQFISFPSVVFDGGGYATSTDGIVWEKYDDPTTPDAPYAESDPVLMEGLPGTGDDDRTTAPSVLLIDSTFHMWYVGNNPPGSEEPEGIGHATSSDGIHWERDTLNNPVLVRGNTGEWDDEWVFGPCVVSDGLTYHMWYMAWNGILDQVRIGHATSPDGISWTKDENNPVISGESWDLPRVDMPDVVFDGTTFHMWYSGGEWYRWRFGYATSTDGSTWTKHDENPVMDWGEPGSWEDYCVVSSATILDTISNTFKMWYSGADSYWRNQIGYAVDFSNIVHSDSLSFSSTYYQPDVDTLEINARIVNPEQHTLTVKAQIISEDSAIVDSMDLREFGDGIWSGKWSVPEGEKNYLVGIKTIDEQTGAIHDGIMWNIEKFTTIGPVNTVGISDPIFSGLTPNRIAFDVTLKNFSSTITVKDIGARIYPDTTHSCFVSMGRSFRDFGDLDPGEQVDGQYTMTIDTTCLKDPQIIIPFNIKISSGGYVFWEDSSDIIVSDIEGFSNVIPGTFGLNQNYPNPFNPTTFINYELPITNDVELSIYNLIGQKIVTLVKESQRAGYHQVEWDASGFASGVYYYRIEAGEFVDVKKMILIR
jgi:hypothetical protein